MKWRDTALLNSASVLNTVTYTRSGIQMTGYLIKREIAVGTFYNWITASVCDINTCNIPFIPSTTALILSVAHISYSSCD